MTFIAKDRSGTCHIKKKEEKKDQIPKIQVPWVPVWVDACKHEMLISGMRLK